MRRGAKPRFLSSRGSGVVLLPASLLAAILRLRVCAPYLSWSARDPLSENLSSPRGPIPTPTRYRKAVDAGEGGEREKGRAFPGRSEAGRGRGWGERCGGQALPLRLTLGGEGEPGAAAPGGEATPSLPSPPSGSRGREPQVPRGPRIVAGPARPWPGREWGMLCCRGAEPEARPGRGRGDRASALPARPERIPGALCAVNLGSRPQPEEDISPDHERGMLEWARSFFAEDFWSLCR